MVDAFSIPASWVLTQLGDCCETIMGQSPPSDSYNSEGIGLPFFQGKSEFGTIYPTPRKWCDAPGKIAEPNDVLISVRAPVGPTNLCAETSCIGRGLAAIRPLGGIEPRYILYALRSSEDTLAAKGTGSTFAAISGSVLREHMIPLAPLAEQHRIVAEIETQLTRLDASVAALKRAQANLKRYRAAVLKAACEGRLVPTEAELASSEGRRYEDAATLVSRLAEKKASQTSRSRTAKPRQNEIKEESQLSPLPQGWIWTSVESLSTKVVDGVHKKPTYVDEGIPFVTVRNLTAGPGISFQRLNYITEDDHREFVKRANPERGDILVSKDGTLGVVRQVDTDAEFSIFVSVALIKPIDASLSKYLVLALSSPQVQIQMVPKGTGLQHIHLEDLRQDRVPVPPLDEQHRIVEEVERRLSVVEEMEKTVAHGLRRAERLRQAILRKAFAGELAPQDPADEPASVLLERIRAERAATAASGRRRKRVVKIG